MPNNLIEFSKISETSLRNMEEVLFSLLPDQGAIEVQNDQADKEHSWHKHETDETLVILYGTVKFYYEHGDKICQRGDIIHLPKEVMHGSIALEEGCIYIIAMKKKPLRLNQPI